MSGGLATLAGLLLSGGLLALLHGLARRERPTRPPRRTGPLWTRLTRRPPGAQGRRRDAVLAASLAGGVAVAALSGWVVAVVLAPLLALGLPYLLRKPQQRDVEILEALDRWVRGLSATIGTGRSVSDALRLSRRTAPAVIRHEVGLLVARLDNRWDTRDALQRFADALDSPDADGVVAALMLAAGRGASGASVTLHALAESLQAQLKGRRAIEVERSKPYVVVRQVTLISLVTLVVVFVLSPQFFAAYRTPLGQALLSVLLVLYLGSLLLMRRKAHQHRRSRILVGEAR